jgi:hypothetical protein
MSAVIVLQPDRGLRGARAHTGLADINAEFEQFAVNARGSPERILATEAPNQFTNVNGKLRWPGLGALSGVN